MSAHAQSSPHEQLTALLDEHERETAEWLEQLPMLRAKTAATGAVLDRLAQTWPTDRPRHRGFADVVFAASTEAWLEDVVARLRGELPSGAGIDLGERAGIPRDEEPPTGFTVSCRVSLPGMSGAKATGRVRAALAGIEDVDVDYSEPLDLIVVSPGRLGSS